MTRRMLFACMGISMAALCAPTVMPVGVRDRVLVAYNPSDSVPRGWYRIGRMKSADSLHVGSIVLAQLPAEVAAFAARRGYLPGGVPILKRIGALSPQSVCVREQVVRVDGVVVAKVRTHDGLQWSLQAWPQCRSLVVGELFLLSDTNPASFDSRYFGPIAASAVLGVAQPLWTWSTP